MKIYLAAIYLASIALSLAISGCSIQREPGPAERIGRALDEMRKGVAELAPDETPEERRAREDREWQRRQDEYYRRRMGDQRRQDYGRPLDKTADIYRDSEQERRDQEFWDTPPAEDSREQDRY